MSQRNEPLNFLEDLADIISQAKSQNLSANEDFDLEVFVLGYITALQSLSNIDRFQVNLNDLISARNLESKGKITKNERYEYLANVLLLTNDFENKKHQISKFKILPNTQKPGFLPKIPLRERSSADQTALNSTKRSKSNESKQRLMVSTIVKNSQSEECFLCLQEMKNFNQLKLDACGHSFHKKCLQTYISEEFDNRKFPFCCPLASCQKEIEPQVLAQKFNFNQLTQFWEYAFDKSLEIPHNKYSWCPSYGCKYFYVACTPLLMLFPCPLCSKTWCLNCRAEYHRGKTCQTYQIEKGIYTNISYPDNIIKFKVCPKCQSWNSGNDEKIIQCSKCEYKFQTVGSLTRLEELSESGEPGETTELYKMIMRDQKEESAKLGNNKAGTLGSNKEEEKMNSNTFSKGNK